jgi:aryl-alcohol dehydrogenase-like predicted oxidoreductase
MQLRNLGKSGLRVSVVGLGCNNFGGRIGLDASRQVVDRAIDLGITFFDTADIYGNAGGSETILGEILGDRRKDIVLATKFGMVMSEEQNRKGASRATSCVRWRIALSGSRPTGSISISSIPRCIDAH